MLKLAYDLGCLEALIKLGATVVMKELTPAQKAYMQRRTEFGAPTQPLPPSLRKAQREFKHFVQTKAPELIGASETYQAAGGGLTPAGMAKSRMQGYQLTQRSRDVGHQLLGGPSAGAAAIAADRATKAEPLAAAAQRARAGRAATQAVDIGTHATQRATPSLLRRLGTVVTRRFAHV